MKANLMNARKAYFAEVHRIQRNRNCTFNEAKKLYSQANGKDDAPLTDLTPDALVDLAHGKIDQIGTQIKDCQIRIGELQIELGRWYKLANAMATPVPDDDRLQAQSSRSGLDGPPPPVPQKGYVAVG